MDVLQMRHYLVGDIGGTHARFGIASHTPGKSWQPTVKHQARFHCADFATAEECLSHYLQTLPGLHPEAACLAVAGPVTGNTARLTNAHWQFSVPALRQALSLPELRLINDFAAQAAAVPYLSDKALLLLKTGDAAGEAPSIVLGPGTGLGIATLVPDQGRWRVLPGEGGHVRLAPASALSQSVLSLLSQRTGYVCAEHLLSGPGLLTLYRCIAELQGQKATATSPREITAAALTDSDALCRQSLNEFCALLGSLAGDVALIAGARGGVYLSGGILPALTDFLPGSPLLPAFLDKGVMSPYLAPIPLHLITAENPALIGAAADLLFSGPAFAGKH